MRMLVVTNRRINNPDATDETLFGEEVNIKGPSEIRLAWVERVENQWRLELVPEPDMVTEENRPSREVFQQFKQQLTDAEQDGRILHSRRPPELCGHAGRELRPPRAL